MSSDSQEADYALNMGGPGGGKDDATLAIEALTSAYALAAAAIELIEDPDLAFARSTQLGAALRVATDRNGALRALLAARVADANPELDLTALAERLSTPEHPIKKVRAHQLVKAGRRGLSKW